MCFFFRIFPKFYQSTLFEKKLENYFLTNNNNNIEMNDELFNKYLFDCNFVPINQRLIFNDISDDYFNLLEKCCENFTKV